MIKTKRIDFTEILHTRFDNKAASDAAIDLHAIGIEVNAVAFVADKRVAEDGDGAQILAESVSEWMEEIQTKVQKLLRDSLESTKQ